MSLLRTVAVRKRFGATIALDGVDLDVRAGEVHALIGENGAGKSTLLNIISGLLAADSGEIILGTDRRGIAYIHQELTLCLHLSVAENMLLGAEGSSLWLHRERLEARAAALLREFGRGDIDPRGRAGDLSVADRQVVEICRALAWDARLILMDEPTSSLERPNVERLFRVIAQLRDRGIGIVYISHFLEEVREIATRYTVLRDGKSVRSGELRDTTDDQLIAAMIGRDIENVFPPRGEAVPGEIVLEARDLASPPRLQSATLELRRGEILGIAGLVGSGRTDLVRTLFGLQRATAGSISIRGTLGYVSEDRKGEGLALPLSIADNVTISRLSACSRRGWLSRARQLGQTARIMERLRIRAADARVAVKRLSGGNQQKVAFGRLLHQEADVLLLDEPARGIDIGSKSEIYREVVGLAREGKAILMVSSYLPEILGLCDRIAVMSRGRLSPAREASAWTAESIMEVAVGA